MRGFHTSSFDPQTLVVLETAFDEAWLTLRAIGNSTVRPDGNPNFNHVFINQSGQSFVEVTTAATGERDFQCLVKAAIARNAGFSPVFVSSTGRPLTSAHLAQ